jgi:hypothetical protein
MGPRRLSVSLTSPEDGNRSSFRNVVFYSYLEFFAMDKVQKPSDPGKCLLFSYVLGWKMTVPHFTQPMATTDKWIRLYIPNKTNSVA